VVLKKVVRNRARFAMAEVKAVRVDEQQTGGGRRRGQQAAFRKKTTMKNLIKIALVAAFLAAAGTVEARGARGSCSGSSSSSAYVYRNPYSAFPSVRVDGYIRSSGTYVAPYYRTPANGIPYDNLNYRGFGTIRLPRY
jgi:hypothetical protein